MEPPTLLIVFLILLLSPTEETEMNDAFEENFDKVMDTLAFDIQDFLPKPIERKQQAGQEGSMENLKTAVQLFHFFSKYLYKPEQYRFQRLISFTTCGSQGDIETIVQFKLLRQTPSKLSEMKKELHVYCSWIGYFRHNSPRKTLGSACYESKKVLHKYEVMLSKIDPCGEWIFEEPYTYRLGIPRHMSTAETHFPFYLPPGNPAPEITYMIDNNLELPQYTNFRTGMLGLGGLRYLGENLMRIPVILRKHGNFYKILLVRDYDRNKAEGPLPMFYKNPKPHKVRRPVPKESFEEYFHALVKPERKTICSKEKFRSALESAHTLFKNYFPHPQSTDNSWVTATVYLIFTKEEPCFNHISLSSEANYLHYEWELFNESAIRSLAALLSKVSPKEKLRELQFGAYPFSINSFGLTLLSIALVALAISTSPFGSLVSGSAQLIELFSSFLSYYYVKKLPDATNS
ncbi:hypothetical protein TTRE_0000786701 [Trichuris trichiura]|uniref:Uncharacterized protein n=1 Tax=Trichuris trichiura TaxID=36087 RepID=A0A077ZGT5_TRITR|nr:hypothetical protein TTRE_0000786701 [Trichuris trichiura]